jgi:hypothetical protein
VVEHAARAVQLGWAAWLAYEVGVDGLVDSAPVSGAASPRSGGLRVHSSSFELPDDEVLVEYLLGIANVGP